MKSWLGARAIGGNNAGRSQRARVAQEIEHVEAEWLDLSERIEQAGR